MTDTAWIAGAIILGCWMIGYAVERGLGRIAECLQRLSNITDEQREALYQIKAVLRADLDYRDKN